MVIFRSGAPKATNLEPPLDISELPEWLIEDGLFSILADGQVVCFICEEDDNA